MSRPLYETLRLILPGRTVAGQSGDYGDTIEPGWSIGKLKALWRAMLVGSVALSMLLSLIPWAPPPLDEEET